MLVVVAVILPVWGAIGGQVNAQRVFDEASIPCTAAPRCIQFGGGNAATLGRLIASSADHIALLVPESKDVVVLTITGEHVALSPNAILDPLRPAP
jgi:hypothetical protein